MVASRDTKPNKTAFITAHLGENPTANPKSVKEAWAKAGHSGTVSPTLVSKLRRDLGLTGNFRAVAPSSPRRTARTGTPKIKSEGATAKKVTPKAKAVTKVQASSKPTSTGSAGATKAIATGSRG